MSDHSYTNCKPCTTPSVPMNPTLVAIVAVLVIALIYYLVKKFGKSKEGFVTKDAQKVFDRSRELFEKTGGKATYSEYKTAIPTAEAVLYTDTRDLWRKGSLSPESVQGVM
jgi:hypothetical protein